MAFDLGMQTIYSDANTIPDPQILAYAAAAKLPILKGAFYQAMPNVTIPITEYDFEIFTRTLTDIDDAIGAAGWVNATTTTALPMTATAVTKLKTGVAIKVESEIVVVKSVDTSANTIDVYARGAGSTTGAIHAGDTDYEAISYSAHARDAKNLTSRTEESLVYTNYVQNILETLEYTAEEYNNGRKGMTGAQFVAMKQREAMNRVINTLSVASLKSFKAKGTAAGAGYFSAGLYEQLVDTNGATRVPLISAAGTTPLTEDILKAGLELATKTGTPTDIVVSRKNKGIINGFNLSNSNVAVNAQRVDRTAGGTIDTYEYEGQYFNILTDIDAVDDKVAIVNMADCQKGWKVKETLKLEQEEALSIKEKKELISGQIGFSIAGVGEQHALITELT